jgi:uncharacterized membrane protein
MITYFITGLFLVLISLPLYFGKIPPNGLYGLRVKKTMENPDIWYKVNKYSSAWLIAIGLLTAFAALAACRRERRNGLSREAMCLRSQKIAVKVV